MMSKIGFIGVGLMGAAMAHRLIDTGHTLQVLGNRNKENVIALVDRGATEAASAAELAKASDGHAVYGHIRSGGRSHAWC